MEPQQPLLPAYALSAIAVVAAVLGSLVVTETATVKLVVPASRLVANVTLKGGPHGQDIVTTTIQADVSDSTQGTASTLTVIDQPIPNVKVTNPQPITGGTDATSNQVIQQSDLDRVQLTLTAKVTQDIDAALKAQAEGLNYLTDGQPALKVTTDHKVGEQVPTFNMTITATLSAVAFSLAQADSLMRGAVNQKLPKGFQLTADPIQTTYQVQKPTGTGDITIKGTGTGVIVPNVTAGELAARIRGMRVDAARRQLELLAPGTSVDISVKPSVPWLPVLQDHITLTIVVLSAA